MTTEDEVFNAYMDWKDAETKEEELHKKFSEIAEKAHGEGITNVKGLILSKVEKNTSKLDVTMFQTMHPDRYKSLVDEGKVSISMTAIKDFADEVSECISTKKSTYYLLSKPE